MRLVRAPEFVLCRRATNPDFVLDGRAVPRRDEDECVVLCPGAELAHLARPT